MPKKPSKVRKAIESEDEAPAKTKKVKRGKKTKVAKVAKTKKTKKTKKAKGGKRGGRQMMTVKNGTTNPAAAAISALRGDMSQEAFAKKAGLGYAPAVSRLESKEYLGVTVRTLLGIAERTGTKLTISFGKGKKK